MSLNSAAGIPEPPEMAERVHSKGLVENLTSPYDCWA